MGVMLIYNNTLTHVAWANLVEVDIFLVDSDCFLETLVFNILEYYFHTQAQELAYF